MILLIREHYEGEFERAALFALLLGLALHRALLALLLMLWPLVALAGLVKTLKVTMLSTLLSDDGVGEWGMVAAVAR